MGRKTPKHGVTHLWVHARGGQRCPETPPGRDSGNKASTSCLAQRPGLVSWEVGDPPSPPRTRVPPSWGPRPPRANHPLGRKGLSVGRGSPGRGQIKRALAPQWPGRRSRSGPAQTPRAPSSPPRPRSGGRRARSGASRTRPRLGSGRAGGGGGGGAEATPSGEPIRPRVVPRPSPAHPRGPGAPRPPGRARAQRP